MFLAQPSRRLLLGIWLGLTGCLTACSLQMPSESDVFGAAGSKPAANGGAPGEASTSFDPTAGLVAYFTFDEPSGAVAANARDSTKRERSDLLHSQRRNCLRCRRAPRGGARRDLIRRAMERDARVDGQDLAPNGLFLEFGEHGPVLDGKPVGSAAKPKSCLRTWTRRHRTISVACPTILVSLCSAKSMTCASTTASCQPRR